MISITEEQMNNFKDAREKELAKWCADKFSEFYSQRRAMLDLKDQDLTKKLHTILKQSAVYLKGYEEDRDYTKWRIIYAELAFLVGWDFDSNTWTQSILNETIWHPFLRLDILMGVYEICYNNSNNAQFFEKLSEISK